MDLKTHYDAKKQVIKHYCSSSGSWRSVSRTSLDNTFSPTDMRIVNQELLKSLVDFIPQNAAVVQQFISEPSVRLTSELFDVLLIHLRTYPITGKWPLENLLLQSITENTPIERLISSPQVPLCNITASHLREYKVRGSTGDDFFHYPSAQQKYCIIPLIHHERKHYCMAVVWRHTQSRPPVIWHIDTLGCECAFELWLEAARPFIESGSTSSPQSSYENSPYLVIDIPMVPQEDGYSCGPLILHHLHSLMVHIPIWLKEFRTKWNPGEVYFWEHAVSLSIYNSRHRHQRDAIYKPINQFLTEYIKCYRTWNSSNMQDSEIEKVNSNLKSRALSMPSSGSSSSLTSTSESSSSSIFSSVSSRSVAKTPIAILPPRPRVELEPTRAPDTINSSLQLQCIQSTHQHQPQSQPRIHEQPQSIQLQSPMVRVMQQDQIEKTCAAALQLPIGLGLPVMMTPVPTSTAMATFTSGSSSRSRSSATIRNPSFTSYNELHSQPFGDDSKCELELEVKLKDVDSNHDILHIPQMDDRDCGRDEPSSLGLTMRIPTDAELESDVCPPQTQYPSDVDENVDHGRDRQSNSNPQLPPRSNSGSGLKRKEMHQHLDREDPSRTIVVPPSASSARVLVPDPPSSFACAPSAGQIPGRCQVTSDPSSNLNLSPSDDCASLTQRIENQFPRDVDNCNEPDTPSSLAAGSNSSSSSSSPSSSQDTLVSSTLFQLSPVPSSSSSPCSRLVSRSDHGRDHDVNIGSIGITHGHDRDLNSSMSVLITNTAALAIGVDSEDRNDSVSMAMASTSCGVVTKKRKTSHDHESDNNMHMHMDINISNVADNVNHDDIAAVAVESTNEWNGRSRSSRWNSIAPPPVIDSHIAIDTSSPIDTSSNSKSRPITITIISDDDEPSPNPRSRSQDQDLAIDLPPPSLTTTSMAIEARAPKLTPLSSITLSLPASPGNKSSRSNGTRANIESARVLVPGPQVQPSMPTPAPITLNSKVSRSVGRFLQVPQSVELPSKSSLSNSRLVLATASLPPVQSISISSRCRSLSPVRVRGRMKWPKFATINHGLKLIRRSKYGLCLIACQEYSSGVIITEYEGPVLNVKDVKDWEVSKQSHLRTLVPMRLVIDGLKKFKSGCGGGSAVNHRSPSLPSCNAEFIIINDNEIPSNIQPFLSRREYYGPRCFILAKRDIQIGEEICCDYGRQYWEKIGIQPIENTIPYIYKHAQFSDGVVGVPIGHGHDAATGISRSISIEQDPDVHEQTSTSLTTSTPDPRVRPPHRSASPTATAKYICRRDLLPPSKNAMASDHDLDLLREISTIPDPPSSIGASPEFETATATSSNNSVLLSPPVHVAVAPLELSAVANITCPLSPSSLDSDIIPTIISTSNLDPDIDIDAPIVSRPISSGHPLQVAFTNSDTTTFGGIHSIHTSAISVLSPTYPPSPPPPPGLPLPPRSDPLSLRNTKPWGPSRKPREYQQLSKVVHIPCGMKCLIQHHRRENLIEFESTIRKFINFFCTIDYGHKCFLSQLYQFYSSIFTSDDALVSKSYFRAELETHFCFIHHQNYQLIVCGIRPNIQRIQKLLLGMK